MSKDLKCLPNPCSTCPYRKDTPPGIWAAEEYRKLPAYDEQFAFSGIFLCHNGGADKDTLCRGWVEVHERNMGVRMAMFRVKWDEHNRKPTSVALYASGQAAMVAGLAGIKKPPVRARLAIQKLIKLKKLKTRNQRSRPVTSPR